MINQCLAEFVKYFLYKIKQYYCEKCKETKFYLYLTNNSRPSCGLALSDKLQFFDSSRPNSENISLPITIRMIQRLKCQFCTIIRKTPRLMLVTGKRKCSLLFSHEIGTDQHWFDYHLNKTNMYLFRTLKVSLAEWRQLLSEIQSTTTFSLFVHHPPEYKTTGCTQTVTDRHFGKKSVYEQMVILIL